MSGLTNINSTLKNIYDSNIQSSEKLQIVLVP